MEYKCSICVKNYKSYKCLWNHNKQFHPKNNKKTPVKSVTLPENNTNNVALCSMKCTICNKIFNNRQTKWRHVKKCKETLNNKLLEENIILKESVKSLTDEVKELKTLNNDVEQLKKQLSELMNRNCKVHPKTLTKINKQLIDNQINNNQIIDKQININDNKVINNNTINLITLGKEDLSNVLSKKEIINILNKRCLSLDHFIKYIHFNEKYPQFQNILITNINNTIGYKYDEKEKQFIAINKDELLEEIISERVSDINYFYEDYENELDEKTKKLIDEFLAKIDNDDKYRETKKKNIKLIIYNNRNKVSKEITQNLQVIV